jgi:hypothetical protein
MNEYINLFTENADSSMDVSSNEAGSNDALTTGPAEAASSTESTVGDTSSEATSSVEGMSWHPEASLEVLPKAGVGMVVIFAIIGVIIITTALLGKITSKKKDN